MAYKVADDKCILFLLDWTKVFDVIEYDILCLRKILNNSSPCFKCILYK